MLSFPRRRVRITAPTAAGGGDVGRRRRRNAYRDPGSAFEAAVAGRGRHGPERPAALEELERLVTFAVGRSGASDLHFRLRPLLRDMAARRLRTAHGVDLDADPEKARALLGDDLFDLVRADRPPPADRLGPGLEVDTMAGVVERLERL
ncbi:MAG TPA: hypothetical protein VFH45_02805 [Acidimicrobiales bacterium]|nr:hypothetical protein [Acidimicrobiales bacterium]